MSIVPIILFDGPDNVGKGTQIELLRKWMLQSHFTITNLDRPVGDTLGDKERYGINAARGQLVTIQAGWSMGVPQIADRCHYTEYAYSILRKPHELETILELERSLEEAKSDVLGIIFVDEVEKIVERDDGKSNYQLEEGCEEHIVSTQSIEMAEAINQISNRFHQIASESNFECHIISIHQKTIEMVHDEVKNIITKKFPWAS